MRLLLLAVALSLTTFAPAEAQQVTGIEILEHGIYTTVTTNRQTAGNGIGADSVSDIRLAVSTTTVPMQRGVEFGFRFRLTGTPAGATVQIRKVTIFPEPGLKPPDKPIVRQNERMLRSKIGETNYTAYGLDEPFELVPGKWTFQLWVGDRKMGEQSFTVAKQ